MFAAISAAEEGHEVHLFEKNEKCGKKLYITGKGRCNLTNACEMEELFNNVITATANFSTVRSMASPIRMRLPSSRRTARRPRWSGGRVFPLSDHSSDVIGALLKDACAGRSGTFKYRSKRNSHGRK
ncbi:MAG: NAD(P)/FAD-dependent oxidoreductase [Lachnospiraceae bacterium]